MEGAFKNISYSHLYVRAEAILYIYFNQILQNSVRVLNFLWADSTKHAGIMISFSFDWQLFILLIRTILVAVYRLSLSYKNREFVVHNLGLIASLETVFVNAYKRKKQKSELVQE